MKVAEHLRERARSSLVFSNVCTRPASGADDILLANCCNGGLRALSFTNVSVPLAPFSQRLGHRGGGKVCKNPAKNKVLNQEPPGNLVLFSQFPSGCTDVAPRVE